ncbi:MAG TPA: helix-turn-helix domain-containing protein [Chitinophagaceae bacterium]|nr:helix-turn-helix domain-containing protein [Chitinophagaceae bacterium]
MNYQVYTPVAELQEFVKCFWTLEDQAVPEPIRQRVLPDGCMEMIFHYGDLYKQYFEDGSFIVQPRSFVFGQITKYLEIAPTGVSGINSARFLPDGLLPFLNRPVSELENKAVSLEDLFNEHGKKLEQEVLQAADNQQRIKIIEAFLLSRLTDPSTIDNITKDCVSVIIQSRGQVGVVELAGKLKINRRNMERKFMSVIGMSPKQLSRVVRLQATLKMLEQRQFTSLTSLAYENGYYDQAHFIRDFKEFTGISPKLFFADNLKLSTLFIAAE